MFILVKYGKITVSTAFCTAKMVCAISLFCLSSLA